MKSKNRWKEVCIVPGCTSKADRRHAVNIILDPTKEDKKVLVGYFCERHYIETMAYEEAQKVVPL